MTEIKLIVAGSRDFNDYQKINNNLIKMLTKKSIKLTNRLVLTFYLYHRLSKNIGIYHSSNFFYHQFKIFFFVGHLSFMLVKNKL